MTREVSRRTVLVTAGLLAVAGGTATLVSIVADDEAEDDTPIPDNPQLDAMRTRLREHLIGADLPAGALSGEALQRVVEDAEQVLGSVPAGADVSGAIRERLADAPSSRVTSTADGLRAVALAWAVPGQKYHQDAQTATLLAAGLQALNTHAYRSGADEYDNWWDWEIGTPTALGETLVLAHDALPAALRAKVARAIAHFTTPGKMYPRGGLKHRDATGANLVDVNVAAALGAIASHDAAVLDRVHATTLPGLGFVTAPAGGGASGDGLHADGSYVQHERVAYTGTYGIEFYEGVARLATMLKGSPWALGTETLSDVVVGVSEALDPLMIDGRMADAVSGRQVAVPKTSDRRRGLLATVAVANLADALDGDARDRVVATAARWNAGLQTGDEATLSPSFDDAVALARLEAAAAGGRVRASAVAPAVAGVVVFPDMDRVVHRGDGWAVTLSVASTRTARFEMINRTNLKPWNQSAGQLALYLSDAPDQRSDVYWRTVDPLRLPGTTVDRYATPEITDDNAIPAGNGFAGYHTLGADGADGSAATAVGPHRGSVGSAMYQYDAFASSLTARLSWFFLPDAVVCLGADVTGGSGGVETTVANWRVPQEARGVWSVDGTAVAGRADGEAQTVQSPTVLTLEDVGATVFLQPPARVGLLEAERTGSWRDVNASGGTDEVTARYATAWVEHGTKPQGASFAYASLPTATAGEAQQWAAAQSVEVVSNTGALQAVSCPKAGYHAASFFSAGTAEVGSFTVQAERPATVGLLVEPVGASAPTRVEVAVADPARGSDPLVVTVELPEGSWTVSTTEQGTTATVQGGTLRVSAAVAGTGGVFRATLARA